MGPGWLLAFDRPELFRKLFLVSFDIFNRERVLDLLKSRGTVRAMSQQAIFEKLNPEQRAAVEHVSGPILVLAGAGSGKTRVLTHRIAHLVLDHQVDPREILAVTFTNKATEEMKERLSHLLGALAKDLWVSTFHSAALRMLRRFAPYLGFQHSFVVYDEDDTKSLIKGIVRELKIDEKRYPPQFFMHAIDRAKNDFCLPEQFAKQASTYEQTLIADVYDRYQKALFAAQSMDFGDLMVNALRLLKDAPEVAHMYQENLRYVLVDEFQDTNRVQYETLKIMSSKHRNLFVVGDDDQSIYGFRGATVENLLNFERDFPEAKVVKLEQNYRSTKNILTAAHAVIEKNERRKAKQLWSAGPEGELIKTYLAPDESDEAHFVVKEVQQRVRAGGSYGEIAVFYRTNAQSRALEEAFLTFRIPYRIFGALRFYDRKEIKDILAYLRVMINEFDGQAFIRVVNTPPRGVGPQSQQAVVDLAVEKKISLLTAATELAAKSKGLKQFVELIAELKLLASNGSFPELVKAVIDKSGYRERLKELKDPSAQSRLENLLELENAARSVDLTAESTVDAVRRFLDRVTLTSSADMPTGAESNGTPAGAPETGKPRDYVSLMTLHLCKGLEFPVVFLTGMEDGLLPHYKSAQDKLQTEEERRLCYVGMTRAMQQLYLTRARKRGMFQSAGGALGLFREVSPFAFSLPKYLLSSCGPDFISGEWSLENPDSEGTESEFEENDGIIYDEYQPYSTFGPKKKKDKKKQPFSLMSADELKSRG